MGRAHAGRKGGLKRLNLIAADVLAAAQHAQDSVIKLLPQIGKLLTETEGRHLHEGNLKPSLRTIAVPGRDAI